MVKKLSELAGEGSESGLVSTIRESATKIWLAGLGAFSKGQEEGGKLFEALVKEGEAVQNRASKSAQEAITDARSKATGTWDKLEKEVGVIAHSCGVSNPRALRRYHCRVVQADGRSIPMNELYPDIVKADRAIARTTA